MGLKPADRVQPRGRRSGRDSARWLLLGVVALSLGCQTTRGELVPFTEAQRTRYQLGEAELRALQYYVSDRIVLERTASDAAGRVDRGRLVVRGQTAVHQVLVERGTPGAVEPIARVGAGKVGPHVLEVSFERGAPLRFVPSADGTYTLAAPRSRGFLSSLFAGWAPLRRFDVDFDGASWTVVAGSDSKLLIERDALGKLARTRRVLPGVRAPDAE